MLPPAQRTPRRCERGKVNHRVRFLGLKDVQERRSIGDVSDVKTELRVLTGVGDVAALAVGGVEEVIEYVHHNHVITACEERLDDMASDEPRAPRDEYSHLLPYLA